MSTYLKGFIAVPGGKIWYKIAGKNKTKTPLVTLHGGPAAPHDYLEPLEALADERPVVFYDQLGCGLSEKPNDPALWTIERFVEELAGLRRALKLGRFHLMSVSWGTMLAVTYLGLKHPKGILSLTLSGPYLSSSLWHKDQRRYIEQLPTEIKNIILNAEKNASFDTPEYQKAMTAYYQRHVCRLQPWPACLKKAFKKLNMDIYGRMWGPSEFTIRGTLKNADCTAILKDIRIPVLLTCGRYDEASVETTNYYRSLLPNGRMVIFEDASHMHYLEKKHDYMDLLRVFLRSTEEKKRSCAQAKRLFSPTNVAATSS